LINALIAISNKIREKIIKHKKNDMKEEIAKGLIVSKSSVTKIWVRYRNTGSSEGALSKN